jgi:hypothetical protein
VYHAGIRLSTFSLARGTPPAPTVAYYDWLAGIAQDIRLRLAGHRGSRGAHAQYVKNLSTQEEIDALGGGKTIRDWENRFELVYKKCKEQNATLVGDVAPTTIRFARHLHKKHKVYPKDLWKTQIVTLGSVPGINTRYRPTLQALYGPVTIRETCGGATECMFGQQRDERKAWVPNYDLFFLG